MTTIVFILGIAALMAMFADTPATPTPSPSPAPEPEPSPEPTPDPEPAGEGEHEPEADEYVGEPPDDAEVPGSPSPVEPTPESKAPEDHADTEPEEKPEPAPGTAPEPEPEALQADSEILYLAEQHGIPRAEAEKYPSVRALENEVFRRAKDRQIITEREEAAKGGEPTLDLDDLDPEVSDPALIEKVKAMDEVYRKKIAALEQQTAAVQQTANQQIQAQQQAALKSFYERYDNWIANNTDTHSILGTAKAADLQEGAEELGARHKHLLKVVKLARLDQLDGVSRPDEEYFNEAAQYEFGAEIKKTQNSRLSKKLTQRAGQALSRPAGRKMDPDTGEEKAIARAEKAYADAGMPGDVEDDDYF